MNVTTLDKVPKDIGMSKFMMIDHPEILDECIKKIPEEYYEKYKNISSEDISNFVNRLVLDTIYFLKEKDHE